MKKLFTLAQWLIVLLLVGGVVWSYLRPKPQPNYAPETWTSWKGFMAISYAGITRTASEKYPSPRVLLDHLRALRDAGYQPIRPEDAAAFLAGRQPLPERALLIFFEGGNKNNLIRGTPALQRTGFIGVMAVPTMYFEKWGGAYLKKPDLHAAARLPHWAFAGMGHRAVSEIVVDGTGKKGRFLTQRQWIGGRLETDEEFVKRITGDYYTSQDLIEDATLHAVLAYVYPYGDPGTGPNSDPLAAEINRNAVATRFSMAFVRGDDPFNGPEADPFSLSRLRIPGTWDGQRLIRELQQFEPSKAPVAGFANASRWFLEDKAVFQQDALLLGDGGTAWLRGSESWSDLECAIRAAPESGARVALYLRHAGPGSYVRVTLEAGGVLRVQERLLTRLLGLASVSLSDKAAPAEIRVVLRGRRAWVYEGTRRLLGPLPLSRDTASGRLGIGCEGGAAKVMAFSARPNPSYVAVGTDYTALNSNVQRAVQAVISPWFQQTSAPKVEMRHREDALRAAADGVTVIPFIEGDADPTAEEAAKWVELLGESLNNPVLRSLITEIAVRGANPNLSAALRNAGFRVLHSLPPDEAEALCRAPSQLKELAMDRFLLDQKDAAAHEVLTAWLRRLPAPRLIVWQKVFGDQAPFGVRLAVGPNEVVTAEEQP
jgi:hypothetical protein